MKIAACAVVLSLLPMTAIAAPKGVETVSWSAHAQPSRGPARVIGGPALGCIGGAVALPAEGVGYQALRLERNRYYGHPGLIRFVQDLGRKAKDADVGTLLIGDLAQPRGGPMAFGHGSHQSGLDVDVWFRIVPKPLDVGERERPVAVGMVREDGTVSTAWGASQAKVLRAAASHPEVDRIFVNPAIKRAMCAVEAGNRGWLQKLRPWRGHDEHFHVRLRCPADSPDCKPQKPVAPGDGCAEAESWLDAGALLESQFKPAVRHVPPRPVLPPPCSDLLRK